MPFTNHNGINIYYETRGAGEPLILHHGLTFNSTLWTELGYTEILEKKFELILVDARGHGRSDKPHIMEAYHTKDMVADVVSVLDALDIASSHFFGYSMGGRVGLTSGVYAPKLFRSLIIGGMGLIERDSKVLTERYSLMTDLFRMGMTANLAYMENMEHLTRNMREDRKKNDLKALTAYTSLREHIGLQEKISNVSNPCLIFAGEDDTIYGPPAEKCAKLMPNALYHSLPGDHVECLTNVRAITSLISGFLV